MTNDDVESIELRIATSADATVMHDIIQAAFSARPPIDPPAAALFDTVDDVAHALEQGTGVVATLNGVDVGCLLISQQGGQCGIHRVSVRPSAAGSGVGQVVVRAGMQLASDRGAQTLWLVARPEFPQTVRMWQRLGFREVSRDADGLRLERPAPVRVEVPTATAMIDFGRRVAGVVAPGDVIVANGDLGAGKTTFTQGLGAGLGVEGAVISPTFVLSRIHRSSQGPDLVHVDAYRLASADELFDLDLDATAADAVTLIEWGTGLAEGLSDSRLEIDIQRSADPADDTRVCYLTAVGPRWEHVNLRELVADQGESGV